MNQRMKIMAGIAFFVCLLFTSSSFAQIEFAPTGATWTYATEIRNWQSQITDRGLTTVRYDRDTLIGERLAKVLEIQGVNITTESLDTMHFTQPAKIIHQINDSIFLYQNGAFELIYSFAAQPGELVTLASPEFSLQTSIETVAIEMLNGQALKRFDGQILCNDFPWMSFRYFEKVGAPELFLFYHNDICYTDNTTSYSLRCYEDEDFGTHQFSSLPCGQILTNVNDPKTQTPPI
ncbi:MAG: hypothetical protein AAGD05_19690, partial [Bacteroidota bacterium]